MVENGKWLSLELLSRWSLEGMTVYNDCLENIVLNEKHGDNLEKVEWHEDKVGSLFVLCFYAPKGTLGGI